MGSFWSTEEIYDDEEIVVLEENCFSDSDSDSLDEDERSVHEEIFRECYTSPYGGMTRYCCGCCKK